MSTEKEQLEARLAAARSKRTGLEAARAERGELEQLRRDVEAEERAIRDEEAIAKAEVEHGPVGSKIAVIRTELGAVIVKRPNHVAFRKFMDTGSTKTADLEKLVRPCLVHPDLTALERILEELPALLVPIADACAELAGARGKELSGK